MNDATQRITDLEWANYASTFTTAQVTPGLDVILREDVIITSSEIFPFPDANHVCLLRATPQTVDDLIAEAINYFRALAPPTTIYLSPACTPADLPERLLERGFIKQEAEEAWMVLDQLPDFDIPSPSSKVVVRQITQDQVLTFAQVFMTAFDMPVDFAPFMAQLLKPSIDLPNVHYYMALVDEQAVGTCILRCYKNFAILGGTGVAPAHRNKRVGPSLVIEAVREAQKQGVDTLMLQTAANTPLERLLRISGFQKIFTRTCYTLPNELSG